MRFVRASHVRLGLVWVLLLLVSGRAVADAPLRFVAGATTAQIDDPASTPGLVLGGALTLRRWSPLSSVTIAPQLELLFARRLRSLAAEGAGSVSHAMDLIELPLVLRTELTLGGRLVYALAGAYGSVLLQAQRTQASGPGAIVESGDIAGRVDLGLLAGGGLQLASFAWGELFLEARYQRGRRPLLRAQEERHEALSLLLSYGLGADTGHALSWAHDRRLAVKTGLVMSRLPASAFATYGPGIWFGGAVAPARLGGVRRALVPHLELAFVHRNAHDQDTAARSLALDSLDLSLSMRGELAVGDGVVYGLGGVYGSMLVRAQRTEAGAVTDVRDSVSALDAGWLAGAGVELATGTDARLSMELRYQRGIRDLLPATSEADTQQSIACVLGLVYGSWGSAPPRAGRPRPGHSGPWHDGDHAIDAAVDALTRLILTMEAGPRATQPGRASLASCDARAPLPGSGVLAMPAACSTAQEAQESEDALRTVVLALAKDLSALVVRLRPLIQREQIDGSRWNLAVDHVRQSTVAQVEWMVEALHAAQVAIDHAAQAPGADAWWQQAGHHYERALLGAQVLALWVSWLDFAKQLSTVSSYSLEGLLKRLVDTWREMEPMLAALQSGERARIRDAARSLPEHLPAWSQALYAWGQQAERDIRRGQQVLQSLLIVQAAFDVATMRHVIGPLFGRGAGGSSAFVFVLPGIGGITAGGAATGARVVISAEWVRAMEHLIAIGAIATPEIAQIAGVSSLSAVPAPRPAPPAVPPDGRGAAGSSTTNQQRPVKVLVKHRGGNRQVEVNGQRWHLPKGKSPKDIPAADPVGDRLQAELKRIAGEWGPGKLSERAQEAIKNARAAGKHWLARLLERQARGRWVESQAREAFKTMPQLKWSRRGVDVVDRNTGIMYELLSGTEANLARHARRMAGEMFRMITF